MIRKPLLKKLRFAALLLLASLAVLAAGAVAVSVNLAPALSAIAQAKVRALCSQALNDAILYASAQTVDPLVSVSEASGKVYFLQTDAMRMAKLSGAAVEHAAQSIRSLGAQGVTVPLGTVSGITLLSGKGPGIPASFAPVGSVHSRYRTQLTSAGINQTHYRVYMILSAQIEIILPGSTEQTEVEFELPIAESIIVGDVPGAYTNVANEEDMLNLVPEE